MSSPPLSLYVHFPWCVSKCPYCDFNSHALKGSLPEREYVQRLLSDLATTAPEVKGRSVESVFMGGGTPSLFSPGAIAEVLAAINDQLHLSHDAEITLEANPATVELERFSGFRAAGVNRLSIGVRSFDDTSLKALGRAHTAAEAVNAIEAARSAGFSTFNVDLMFGLPGHTPGLALRDIETALDCDVPHISHYQLTLEPNTFFHRFPPALPETDEVATIQASCTSALRQAGFDHYEVSAWAKPNHRCRHNLNYWQFGDYLGIGAGAHGKITTEGGVISRLMRHRHLKHYLANDDSIAVRRTVDPDSAVFEFALNAFRLTEGFPLTLFHARTGLPSDAIRAKLREAERDGLLVVTRDRVETTDLGARFLDDLVARFLPEK